MSQPGFRAGGTGAVRRLDLPRAGHHWPGDARAPVPPGAHGCPAATTV